MLPLALLELLKCDNEDKPLVTRYLEIGISPTRLNLEGHVIRVIRTTYVTELSFEKCVVSAAELSPRPIQRQRYLPVNDKIAVGTKARIVCSVSP